MPDLAVSTFYYAQYSVKGMVNYEASNCLL